MEKFKLHSINYSMQVSYTNSGHAALRSTNGSYSKLRRPHQRDDIEEHQKACLSADPHETLDKGL